MVQLILVGAGAGLAAALLFLSPIGGTFLAFPLFALCGLPLAIVGLAWNSLAAVVGAAVAALVIGFFFSPASAAVYLLLFGLPIAWLCHLAGLSRPADGGGVDWYPTGRMLLHAAIAVAISLILIGVIFGFDPVALTAEMTDAFTRWIAESPNATGIPTAEEVEPFVRFNVAAMPFTMSALLLLTVVFNMWLGSRVADASGRLRRPRPPLWTALMPVEGVALLAAALVVAFVPGGIGHAAGALTGALGAAFGLIGLAVIHAVTMTNNARILILVTTYVLLVLFGFPILFLALLGLAESFFHFRARRLGPFPPLTSTDNKE
jgi:hypothetical protein